MIRKILIIPDCHRPFHSKKAWDLCLEIASFVGIDEIVLLGDFADFYSVSRYTKDPTLPHLLEKEISSVNAGLDDLDKLWCNHKKIYLSGNHEERLSSLILDRAPQLFGLTHCKNLFRLDRRINWTWIEYGHDQSYAVGGSKLLARHRPLTSNARSALLRAGCSYVHGDTHRIEEVHAVSFDKRDLVSFSPGWLGDERFDAFSYTLPQWQKGFAIIYVMNSSKEFHHEIVRIKNNIAICHGKVFKG